MPPKLKSSQRLERTVENIKEFANEFISLEENLEKTQKELQIAINERDEANNNLEEEKKRFAKELKNLQAKLDSTQEKLDNLRGSIKEVDKLPGTKFEDKWRFVSWFADIVQQLKEINVASSYKTITSFILDAIKVQLKSWSSQYDYAVLRSIGRMISATSYRDDMSKEQRAVRRIIKITTEAPQEAKLNFAKLIEERSWYDDISLEELNGFYNEPIFTELTVEALINDLEKCLNITLKDEYKKDVFEIE